MKLLSAQEFLHPDTHIYGTHRYKENKGLLVVSQTCCFISGIKLRIEVVASAGFSSVFFSPLLKLWSDSRPR